MNPDPQASSAPQTGREAISPRLLVEKIRCTPGQPSGYAFSIEQSLEMLREYVAQLHDGIHAQLVEARKLAGTMSELHAKGEQDNARMRAALEMMLAGVDYTKGEVGQHVEQARAALAGTPAPEKKDKL